MIAPRHIATVSNYDELIAALRARADELGVTRETLDAVSGMQTGYCSKLLAPVPIRALGPTSLGPMLGALGLAILVVEDAEALGKISKRIERSTKKRSNAGQKMLATKRRRKHRFPRGPEFAHIMRSRQLLTQSKAKRSRIAKTAAKARWRKPKVTEIKVPKSSTRPTHQGEPKP